MSASCQDSSAVLFGLFLPCCFASCVDCVWGLASLVGPAKSRAQLFGVAVSFLRHDASSCATGVGSRGGGVLGPLGTTVPRGVFPDSAGRPMGPATLQ